MRARCIAGRAEAKSSGCDALRRHAAAGTVIGMPRPLARIEEEIRSLSTAEKEMLLRVLWEELDGPVDSDVEAAWLEEAQRRSAEIDSGAVKTIPSEQVFARLRAKIGK